MVFRPTGNVGLPTKCCRAVDLLLPRTDAGVLAQLSIVLVASGIAIWALRKRPDAALVVIGVTVVTLSLMGLRALH